jgi:hypothetical protein
MFEKLGIAAVYPDILLAVMAIVIFRRGKWKTIKV